MAVISVRKAPTGSSYHVVDRVKGTVLAKARSKENAQKKASKLRAGVKTTAKKSASKSKAKR